MICIPEQKESPPKRMALVGIDVEMLARLMHLPDGITSDAVTFDERTQELIVRIKGDELPEVREGMSLTKFNVWLKTTNAVTLEDEPRRANVVEFDRFS